MKKLLSLLSAVSLTAAGASSIIACGSAKTTPVDEPKTTPVDEPKTTPVDEPKTTPVDKTSSVSNTEFNNDNEKQRKMKYFNELNNIIQKNKTKLLIKIKLLENKNKVLDQEQTSIKEEIKQIKKDIEWLNNQVGKTGSEIVELAHKKKIKIVENNKNNKILELIINQFTENEKEIQQLNTQYWQQKFYINEINSITLPEKIIIPSSQKNKNKIYVLEKDMKKIVLKELQIKINNNLTEFDFIIEFEPKYINHTGTVAIELSHSKTIKIKIHGKNNLTGETNWINISLPVTTIV